MSKIHFKKEPNLAKKLQGFDYQLEAFHAIKDQEYAAVFHEQGLGKTKIAIDVFLYWIENRIVDTVLVVAKRSLLDCVGSAKVGHGWAFVKTWF